MDEIKHNVQANGDFSMDDIEQSGDFTDDSAWASCSSSYSSTASSPLFGSESDYPNIPGLDLDAMDTVSPSCASSPAVWSTELSPSHELKQSLFGTVYLAHNKCGERVVVKQTDKTILETQTRHTRIAEDPREEIRMHEALRRAPDCDTFDYIVRPISSSEDDNNLYLVLEYCSGGELFDLCNKHDGLGASTAKRFLRQIATGLRVLHRQGIAHRDMSLENVFLTHEGVCKIGDMGQACYVDVDADNTASSNDGHKHARSATAGKPAYRPPEDLLGGASPSLGADVFALGVCLFSMLTGCFPFAAAAPTDGAWRIISQGPCGLRKLVQAWGMESRVDDDAIGLLGGMLAAGERRLTVEQVLDHPFLR